MTEGPRESSTGAQRPQASTDDQTAATLAAAAVEPLRQAREHVGHLPDDVLRRHAYRVGRACVEAELALRCPADVVLSPHSEEGPGRLVAQRLWIVQPLDGMREFADLQRTDWAVDVALVTNNSLVAGAVALPALPALLSTAAPAASSTAVRRRRIAVRRTRPSARAERLARLLDVELVPAGSSIGATAMAVVRGAVHAYLHAGPLYEWDVAAPVAVASAVGLHCSQLDGSELRFNQPDPVQPDLVICRPELAETILEAFGTAA